MGAPHPDRDGRERRGRRPRRRRGKGRGGFPDSKYASPNAPVETKPEAGELSEAVELEEEELPVLPGESISKYSQSESEPEVEDELDSAREPEPEPEPADEPASEKPIKIDEPPVTEPPVSEPPPVGEPAMAIASEPEPVAVAEPEIEHIVELRVALPEIAEAEGLPREALEAEEDEVEADDEVEATDQVDVAAEAERPVDGVDPARIPTSLTAALR
jgi:hypothetical protein